MCVCVCVCIYSSNYDLGYLGLGVNGVVDDFNFIFYILYIFDV